MKTRSTIITLLFLCGLLIAESKGLRAAESWATDPKTSAKIGWISETYTLEAVTWSGGIVQGKAEGKGLLLVTLRDKQGKEQKLRVDAETKSGFLNGHVSIKWPSGETFEGSYKMGIREGRGVSRLPSGTILDYEWKNGVREGRAILKWANGDSFEGEMKNNQYNNGIYKWADRSTYEGEWKDDRMAKGVRKWPDGRVYTGEFKNARAHGKGIMKYSNGATYEGDFVDDRPTGNGVLKDPRGAAMFSGERKDLQDESLQQFYTTAEPLAASVPSAPAIAPAPTLAPPTSSAPAPSIQSSTREPTVRLDVALLRELREHLYELNFDPGAADAQFNEADRRAIREFEKKNNLPQAGEATVALLDRLRSVGGQSPWGSIVFARSSGKWGMAWGHASRKDAVANAVSSCGDARECTVELSFFGKECGAFAYSGTTWALAARENGDLARAAALADCQKGGRTCRVVASVCASGSDRRQVDK